MSSSGIPEGGFTCVSLDNSRSQRLVWLLEELDLPYQLKEVKRQTKDHRAPPELKEIHPLGKAPVLLWTENGVDNVLAESGAIVELLIERWGKGKLSGGPGKRQDYLYYLHYTEGSLMTPLFLHLLFSLIPKLAPFLARPLLKAIFLPLQYIITIPDIKTHLAYLEDRLGDKPFFLGDELTGADILLSYPIINGVGPLKLLDKYPRLSSWAERCQKREAFQRAVAKAGPIDYSDWV